MHGLDRTVAAPGLLDRPQQRLAGRVRAVDADDDARATAGVRSLNLTDDGDRQLGVRHAVLAHRAEGELAEPVETARPDDEEIGVAGEPEEALCWKVVDRPSLDRRGRVAADGRHHDGLERPARHRPRSTSDRSRRADRVRGAGRDSPSRALPSPRRRAAPPPRPPTATQRPHLRIRRHRRRSCPSDQPPAQLAVAWSAAISARSPSSAIAASMRWQNQSTSGTVS